MFSTGNATVDALGKLHFEGNIIPHTWFTEVKMPNGKTDAIGALILSEIVYWYRPTYFKDEHTGQLKGMKKRFKADLLQRSYDSFVEQFGFTKRQVRDACQRLEKLGVIRRDFRTIEVNGTKMGNVLFIDLNVEKLSAMTFKDRPSDVITSYLPTNNVTPQTLKGHTNTESTTKTTQEIKTLKDSPPKRRKRVYEPDSLEMKIAEFFFAEILKNNPNHKKPNLQTWSDEIRKMLEIDNRPKDEIGKLIKWVQADSFEMSNVLSPAKLRDRYDALIIKMNKGGKHSGRSEKRTGKNFKPVESGKYNFTGK